MTNSRNTARRRVGVFWALAICLTTGALLVGNAEAQATIVNCPTETSKTVLGTGTTIQALFTLGSGGSCYCTQSQPSSTASPGAEIMPDVLTYRVEAQQSLDFLHQNGAGAFAIQIWQTRADKSFQLWTEEKLTDTQIMVPDADVVVQAVSGEFSVVNTSFCYALSQLQALHAASKANAQAVVDLHEFLIVN